MPAPVALFVYNRPLHTRKTLAALERNSLARSTDLLIFADSAKSSLDIEAVQQVRQIAREARGFRDVTIVERDRNYGLSRSIVDGVNTLFQFSGQAIVVEDDIVVAPGFLQYMNAALERYESDERVMQISGYMFPVGAPLRPNDAFFLRLAACWGWATWRRAWNKFDQDTASLVATIRNEGLQQSFNVEGSYPYFEMLEQQSLRDIDSWAVRWYASMFLARGLCLHPGQSLVQNIGYDGTGVHRGEGTDFVVELSTESAFHFPDEVIENQQVVLTLAAYFKRVQSHSASWIKRLSRAAVRVARLVRNRLVARA